MWPEAGSSEVPRPKARLLGHQGEDLLDRAHRPGKSFKSENPKSASRALLLSHGPTSPHHSAPHPAFPRPLLPGFRLLGSKLSQGPASSQTLSSHSLAACTQSSQGHTSSAPRVSRTPPQEPCTARVPDPHLWVPGANRLLLPSPRPRPRALPRLCPRPHALSKLRPPGRSLLRPRPWGLSTPRALPSAPCTKAFPYPGTTRSRLPTSPAHLPGATPPRTLPHAPRLSPLGPRPCHRPRLLTPKAPQALLPAAPPGPCLLGAPAPGILLPPSGLPGSFLSAPRRVLGTPGPGGA